MSITVSWTPVAGATGYLLAYAPYPWLPSMTLDDIGYADMGPATDLSLYLWQGAAYFIAVQAYDGQGGKSDFSNIDYFIMGPPTSTWVDDDGDGYHENSGDCDDSRSAVNPGGTEICGNLIDEDCNGVDLVCPPAPTDLDGDGVSVAQGDCNDSNPAILPGVTESCGDNIDMNCDGEPRCSEEIDYDGDGFTEFDGDCNEMDPAIHPGAVDACGDEVDQDCVNGDLLCAETASTPVFNPPPGSYLDEQQVTLSTSTSGAQIYYSIDGGAYNLYQGPFAVASPQLVRAYATKSGYNKSPVAGGNYVIDVSLTGTWAVTHITGNNNCGQTVGERIEFNADVVQTGNAVTVTTAAGSGSGTINGNQGTWTTTQPVNYESINGTVTFTMNVTVAPSWDSFSGPTSFTFSDGTMTCSGVGSISGTRVQ